MPDYVDDTQKQRLLEQKTTYKARREINSDNVEIIIEPPGELEPTDDRKRQGIHRIEYRSRRKPDTHRFVYHPLLQPGGSLDGATVKSKTQDLFHKRMDWEKNAPRFVVSPPRNGETEAHSVSMGMMDFWYDKGMYGKVDLNQVPVYISENYLLEVHEGDAAVMTVNFVAHAWRAFELEWSQMFGVSPMGGAGQTRKVAQNTRQTYGIHPDSVFKPDTEGKIALASGWQSVHPKYHDHMTGVFSQFQQWLQENNRYKKVLTFKDWVRMLMYYFDAHAPGLFLTRHAFVMSRKCPRAISGFEIRLAEEDPNDDIIKKEQWLSDPNFEVWVGFLRKYGFSVDFNCPWRVVADVNSTPMREFIRDYTVEGRWGNNQSRSIKWLRAEATRLKRMVGQMVASPNSETESARLLRRAERYDQAALEAQTQNLDIMFKTCYYRTDHTDLLVLMNYITSWWNDYCMAFPVQRTTQYMPNANGPANQTVIVEYPRHSVPYDGAANPSTENLRNPYSILAGKQIYRRAGDKDTSTLRKSSYDVWASTFGEHFPARFYMYVRAREAAVDWDQRTFEENVKKLAEFQKNLDGESALRYINIVTNRLPNPGGNPPFRRVENKQRTGNVFQTRERELAGRGKFMIKIK